MQKKFANDWCEHDFVKFIRSADTERAGVKGASKKPILLGRSRAIALVDRGRKNST